MDKEKVYIVINKKASIQPDKDILVENLGEVYCDKPDIKKAIENIRVKKRNIEEDWDYITATDISEKVLGKYPDIDLDLLGEVEVLIEYKSREKERPFLEFVKVLLVCIVLFFGASIAIINFHSDVDAKQSMEKLYFTFTGEKKDNPLVMNIPYSIGIGVGVLTFFTRIFSFSNRRKKEPGPMEIELFLYDEDMEKFILNETKKRDQS
ncbi:stage V sporulation protein AA [Tissierella praeacuta]|uniref:stage V sporulation protein AA n=1 Tax=Tissierella praeacuta TaxID=43131 RepID=UPI003342B45A